MDHHTPLHSDSVNLNAGSVKRQLRFSSYESTPYSMKSKSRKRKSIVPEISETSLPVRKLDYIVENQKLLTLPHIELSSNQSICESSFSDNDNSTTKLSFNEIFFDKTHFGRSSPVNNKTCDDFKLSSSLEKCTIQDFDYKCESHNIAKKCKWDDEELECSKKSSSAPGTPQRSETESDSHLKKFHSLEFTPTKIGTPERNEILYPQLIEVKPAVKPKSPSKLRHELKRVTKPARKRLFSKDFVYLFTNVRKLGNIINKIFSYLDDSDLVNVAKVSNLWKTCLETDKDAYKRYRFYLRSVATSKENIYFNSILKTEVCAGDLIVQNKSNLQLPVPRSPPISPARENWNKFYKMATQLNSSQRLTKCLICCHPAVTEKSIAQCSKENCGYLWCMKCMSGSISGPTDFNCSCRSPPSPLSDRSGLSDISNIDGSASYYFTEEHMQSASSGVSSSGYFSHSDIEKTPIINQNLERKLKLKNTVLTDWNKNVSTEERHYTESTINILQHSAARQRIKQNLSKRNDTKEPTSPQKVKVHPIGSKQCKRNLRRLCY